VSFFVHFLGFHKGEKCHERREIYPLPEKLNLDFSLVSPTTHATTEEKEREREHHRWSRFRGLFLHLIIECVFFVGVFFLVHFWSLKKDRAFVVNIFPFQR